MAEYKTPGVYIKEKNAFGTSVVEAETAIPAFIGLTEKALNGNDDLTNVPWKISSMNEFIQYFGGGPKLEISVKIEKKEKTEEEKEYSLSVNGENSYPLYQQMQLFFANGGGTCYVVSVKKGTSNKLTSQMVDDALEALKKEREVTLIVVPEAVASDGECANIQQSMMKHCGEMGNRFAILDVPMGDTTSPLDKRIENFQDTVTNYFSYGAAYFPWLNTTVLSDRDLTGDMIEWDDSVWNYAGHWETIDPAMAAILKSFSSKTEVLELKDEEGKKEIEVPILKDGNLKYTFKFSDYSEVKDFTENDLILNIGKDGKKVDDEKDIKITGKIVNLQQAKVKGDDGKETVTAVTLTVVWCSKENLTDKEHLHSALYSGSPLYKQAIKRVLKQQNLLPPSAAMAGIYTMVDHSRGVWKAPANVSLNYVDSPAEDLDDDEQANLNAPMTGKAVNVIRTFRGEGVKVWGARTLDGNSLDWRYINVRRTLLFLEESVKNAARAYVFEPNDAGTWINMKCMIENFLRSVWKRGGLAGATPEEAFEVHVGLGDTMTADDILEGIMRITVLVAVTHPAEFIEITFQQQMQKS